MILNQSVEPFVIYDFSSNLSWLFSLQIYGISFINKNNSLNYSAFCFDQNIYAAIISIIFFNR